MTRGKGKSSVAKRSRRKPNASAVAPQKKTARQTPAAKTDPPPQAEHKEGEWRSVNRVQLAALMGVHEDTITDYARQGMPVTTRGGRGRESDYDSVECLAWLREREGKNAKERAQTRLFEANAQTAELKLQVAQSELISGEEAVRACQALGKGTSAKVLLIPTRAYHLGIIDREQAARIRVLCREILTDIASWKTVADAMTAATAASEEEDSGT